jgi:hypothetical protein
MIIVEYDEFTVWKGMVRARLMEDISELEHARISYLSGIPNCSGSKHIAFTSKLSRSPW